MNRVEIYKNVTEILKEYIENLFGDDFFNNKQTIDYNVILSLILSDSKLAINFIVLLENEFEIELPDNVISINFFESIDFIVDSIYN
jgi:acyl carrier protein